MPKQWACRRLNFEWWEETGVPGGNPRDQVASQRKCTDIAISEKNSNPNCIQRDSNPRSRGQSLFMLPLDYLIARFPAMSDFWYYVCSWLPFDTFSKGLRGMEWVGICYLSNGLSGMSELAICYFSVNAGLRGMSELVFATFQKGLGAMRGYHSKAGYQ